MPTELKAESTSYTCLFFIYTFNIYSRKKQLKRLVNSAGVLTKTEGYKIKIEPKTDMPQHRVLEHVTRRRPDRAYLFSCVVYGLHTPYFQVHTGIYRFYGTSLKEFNFGTK